jgi:small subunit ribosomal protein S13
MGTSNTLGTEAGHPQDEGTDWDQTSAKRRKHCLMARLMGVDLPRDKRMEIALTYIYGIGRTRSQEILAATGIERDLRTKDLTDDQVTQLRD